MVPQFAQQAQSSFILWFDNHLLSKGRAFSNKTGQLYYAEDSRLPSPYRSFSSQYKQWVGDSSISGATIPSGIWVGNNFSGRANNIILDFENGRAIASGLSTSAIPTGTFAVKEFNIYSTNENLEDLIVEKKYIERPKVGSSISKSGIAPYEPLVPAIFINTQSQENEPFAFGGEDKTTMSFSATVICENSFQLDGVLGLFADTNEKTIPLIPFTGVPYTPMGDLKGGAYNYQTLAASSTELPMYVEKVTTARITDKARKAIENNLYIGLLDFEVSKVRYPRA
jgi:hypothetical protein